MRHGSNLDPPNRFDKIQREPVLEWWAEEDLGETKRNIEYMPDQSATIVSKNNSPDLPFNLSLNPYRGCVHGCAYCYARPTHEYLGFNAGLDFETRIMIKENAPQLFGKFLASKKYQPELIAFSGVTDCYQPVERQYELTRRCLQVALDCRQPIGIVTKNALVLRDRDILSKMAALRLVHVYLSITTLDSGLAREMEPRTSIPKARLRAIEELSSLGIPVGVMFAPVIPGLNDSEMPNVLKSARDAGARCAGYVLLRLPLTVEPVFQEWIMRSHPDKAEMVMGRIRQTRNGSANDSQFGRRMVGTGPIAKQIRSMFRVYTQTFGLADPLTPYDFGRFVKPSQGNNDRQRKLF